MNSIHHLNSLFVVCESHRGLSIYYITWNQRNIPYLLERKIVCMKKAWKIDENDIKVWKFLTKFYLSDVTHKRPFWRFLSHQSAETKCNGTLTHSLTRPWNFHFLSVMHTQTSNTPHECAKFATSSNFFYFFSYRWCHNFEFLSHLRKKNYNFISPDILI